MKYIISISAALLILAAGIYTIDRSNSYRAVKTDMQITKTVILDAGHGGEDGGTSAPDGTLEKDINLMISKDIGAFFDFFGVNYIPVRNSDISVCDNGLDTVRKRKYSDIMNRFSLVNSTPDSVLLSIHQNYFQQPEYSGTQVFYAEKTVDSKELAESIQIAVVTALQPENDRVVMAADENIYLLHKAKNTSVMVECGFLSNPGECEKLKTKAYQTQMAYFIFRGTLNYLSDEKDA